MLLELLRRANLSSHKFIRTFPTWSSLRVRWLACEWKERSNLVCRIFALDMWHEMLQSWLRNAKKSDSFMNEQCSLTRRRREWKIYRSWDERKRSPRGLKTSKKRRVRRWNSNKLFKRFSRPLSSTGRATNDIFTSHGFSSCSLSPHWFSHWPRASPQRARGRVTLLGGFKITHRRRWWEKKRWKFCACFLLRLWDDFALTRWEFSTFHFMLSCLLFFFSLFSHEWESATSYS